MNDTIQSALKCAAQQLHKAAASFPLKPTFESEILLSLVLGQDRIYLHSHSQNILSKEKAQEFFDLIAQRAQGKPIEYLSHSASFYNSEFYVDENVLIPRPETELLVEKASKLIAQNNLESIAEVGVGSGAVSISLALLHPHCHFYATDISQNALKVAQKNYKILAPSAHLSFHHCSVLENEELKRRNFDLIISNPPYLNDDYPISAPLSYEPPSALFGGNDGCDVLRALIKEAQTRQTRLLCEIGYDQKARLESLLSQSNAKEVAFYKDLSGYDRGFYARF